MQRFDTSRNINVLPLLMVGVSMPAPASSRCGWNNSEQVGNNRDSKTFFGMMSALHWISLLHERKSGFRRRINSRGVSSRALVSESKPTSSCCCRTARYRRQSYLAWNFKISSLSWLIVRVRYYYSCNRTKEDFDYAFLLLVLSPWSVHVLQ